jgi:hypothetical protein
MYEIESLSIPDVVGRSEQLKDKNLGYGSKVEIVHIK